MSYCPGIIYRFAPPGDFRTNENLGLAAIQTVWVRFHNLVVDKLPKRQDANIALQEARRVTTAMYLHIVYNEYLPLLIGAATLNIC